ncbi:MULTISPECIES: sodium:solute symporter [unclassified Janthinobacterium]|uniref:sodium:solute symporter family protein n=1 Tax=unclassified Janthinobacterium TaxID=2610881 RepID=UPI00161F9305|nr:MULTISPECIES: sodium:solute symporter family protein [unclassified Janthinobacterium]MBB5370977.1 SSS family solute:Na+ symporter [Janthinobacterium sp. K2C7]MBB5383783.1 SSS family solute:Na+ symporter [Janthinobacterium sp. K2Li3]MBB5388288.1 SSS family solute:Na+ symporter [Janthinobacterium sp. K2E3]
METRLIIIAAVVVGYFAIMSYITYSVRKHANSSEGMTAGGRNFPAYLIGALLLSEFIGSSVSIGTAQKGYELGISAAWNLVALSLGFLLLAFVLVKKYKESGQSTISGILAQTYGEPVRYAASVLTIVALGIVAVALYASGGAVLAAVLHINKTVAILLVGATTVIYVSLGGMRSVVYTNFAHSIVKYLGVILALAYALEATGGIGALQAQLPATMFNWIEIGWGQIIAWMIGGIGSIFATQYVIQALVSTDNPAVAKRACYYVSSLMIPFGLMAALIGMCSAVLYPGMKSIDAFPTLIAHMPAFSASVMVVGLAGALFGGISATTLASATLAMKDFYDPWLNKAKNDAKSLAFLRIAIVVAGLLPLVLALYAEKLLMIAFLGKALRATLAVLVLMAFYAPKFGTPRGAFVGVIVSVIATIGWFLAGNPYGVDSSYLALAGPLLTMGISHLFKDKQAAAIAGSRR